MAFSTTVGLAVLVGRFASRPGQQLSLGQPVMKVGSELLYDLICFLMRLGRYIPARQGAPTGATITGEAAALHV
jgi:hypothetical protein